MKKLSIVSPILVENNDQIESIKRAVHDLGHDIRFVPDIRKIGEGTKYNPDLLVLEPSLFHWEWLDVLLKFRLEYPKIPLVLFSAMATADNGFASIDEAGSVFVANDVGMLQESLAKFAEDPPPPRKKILFVDDDLNVLNTFPRMLRKSPWEVVKASSGDQALSILQAEKIDIIVTDIKMPEMHGVELISRIRKARQNLPIVVSSAYPGMKEDNDLKFHEIAAFIEKPINSEMLIDTLTQLLKKSGQ